MNPKSSKSNARCLYKFQLEGRFTQHLQEIPFRIMSNAAGIDENKTNFLISMKENQIMITCGIHTFLEHPNYYENFGINLFYDKMIIFNNPDVISFRSVMDGNKVDSLKMEKIFIQNMCNNFPVLNELNQKKKKPLKPSNYIKNETTWEQLGAKLNEHISLFDYTPSLNVSRKKIERSNDDYLKMCEWANSQNMISSELDEKEFCKAAEDFALEGTILPEDKISYNLFFQSGQKKQSPASSSQTILTKMFENLEKWK